MEIENKNKNSDLPDLRNEEKSVGKIEDTLLVKRTFQAYFEPSLWICGLIFILSASSLTFVNTDYHPLVQLSHVIAGLICIAIACWLRVNPGAGKHAVEIQGWTAIMLVIVQIILMETEPSPVNLLPHSVTVVSLAFFIASSSWLWRSLILLHLHLALLMFRFWDSEIWLEALLLSIAILGISVLLHIVRNKFLLTNERLRKQAHDGRLSAETSLAALEALLIEKERLQGQLVMVEKSQSLTRLAGGVAHDLNNLLVPIMGNADLLASTLLSEKQTKMVAGIRLASERAAGFGTQLLSYVGLYKSMPETINLVEELDAILTLSRSSFPSVVTIEKEVSVEEVWVEAIRASMQQLVMNLVVNAAQAVSDGGRVKVTIRIVDLTADNCDNLLPRPDIAPGRYVEIAVHDSGPGIPPDVQLKMFDPFFTTKEMGKGLGLAGAFSFVEQHAGALRVESGEHGVGTTLTLFLPACDAPTPPVIEEKPSLVSDNVQTLLVVDDEADVLEVMSLSLKSTGFEVLAYLGGVNGLAAANEFYTSIDGAVLDVRMPDVDGAELARRIRRLKPGLPILFCSGYDASLLSEELLSLKNVGFITKPFRPKQLNEMMSKLLNIGDTDKIVS